MEVRNSKEVQRMAKCEFCDKGVTFGIKVSHSHRRSNRMWKPNVKRVKAIVDGSPRHVYVCTRCMRSGLPAGTHSLRCSSFSHRNRFAGFRREPWSGVTMLT